MMRIGSLVMVVVLALLLASAVPVAGAKRAATLTNESDPGDCNFHVTLAWENFKPGSYTAHMWWLYDGAPVPHPVYPSGDPIMDWTETVGGVGTMSWQAGFSAASEDAHTMTYNATLSTTGPRSKVLVEKQLTEQVHCLPVGD